MVKSMGKIASLILVLFCVLSAGCKPVERNQTIFFAVGGAPSELVFWEDIARDFHNRRGVRVEILRLPADTDQQRQSLIVSLNAGTANPDVFLMDVAWVGLLAASGWLHPLSGYDASAFFREVLDLVDIHQGAVVALPVYMDAGLLYYRKDLLARFGIPHAPETWPELVDQARRVQAAMRKEHPAFYGFVWQGAQYEGLVTNFLEFTGHKGGFITFGGHDARILVNTPQNRWALNFMHDLIWKYSISPPATYTEMREEETRLAFQEGNALFERNWPYAWALHQRRDSRVRSKTGVTLPPAPPGGQSASALGGWHIGVSKYSDVKAEAQSFVSYVTSYEVQKKMVLRTGWNPGRLDLYGDSEVLDSAPHLAVLREAFKRAKARPVVPYYTQVSAVMQRRLNGALAGRYKAETALRGAEEEIAALLTRFGAEP